MSMKPLIESGQFTLVCLQPRGILPSERPQDVSRMGSKHMAADVDDLRIILGFETIFVLGHSNGAAIMLAYAELFSRHCSKAVLIETQVIGSKSWNKEEEVQKRKGDPRYADAIKAFLEDREAKTDEEAAENLTAIFPLYFVEPESGIAEFANDSGPIIVQVWATGYQDKVDALPEANLVDDLGKVTAEVLLVSGENDWICTVKGSEIAREGIGAKAKHVVYPACGHMPWIEHKIGFFTDVTAFLLGRKVNLGL